MQLAVLELSMRRFLRARQGEANELDGWSNTVLCRSWILQILVDVTQPPPIPQGYPSGTRYAISAEDAKANNKNKKANNKKKDNKDNTNNHNDHLFVAL